MSSLPVALPAADYRNDLAASATPHRGPVRIRSLRHGEQGAIREFYARLTPQTRYFRFLSLASALPDDTMRRLTIVNDPHRLALVAVCARTGDLVGLANLCAVGCQSAEMGLVVRDDWQRRRVGTELAERLLASGETRGFDRFVAHMMVNNVAARRLVARIGHVVSTRMNGGMVELTFVRLTAVSRP
jgi:RimJ/RimL family protein N-acetyltransferase